MHRLLLPLVLLLTASSVSTAQKYGHLNFANLLSQMPGTKAAEAQLEAFNKQLTAKGEQMVVDLKARVQEVEAQVDELAPKRLAELRAELNEARENIVAYERKMGVDVNRKRQELLGPLIAEARAAISAVAEAEGYAMIFDTSQFNTVLYGRDGDDIMPLVRAKLGM